MQDSTPCMKDSSDMQDSTAIHATARTHVDIEKKSKQFKKLFYFEDKNAVV